MDVPQAPAGTAPAAAGAASAPDRRFALTVPIAVQCLITYGVQLTSPRVAVHSLAF